MEDTRSQMKKEGPQLIIDGEDQNEEEDFVEEAKVALDGQKHGKFVRDALKQEPQ